MSIPIFIPKNRAGLKRWLKVVGVLLIVLSIYLSATNMHFGSPHFVKEGTVPFSEMNKSDVYELTDIVVFDNYAVYNDNGYEYEYFTILVKDSDGYSKYASLVTNADDAVYERVMAFNNDFSLSYNECVLNGGFTAVKMNDVKMDKKNAVNLKEWFNKDVSNCQQYFYAESSDLILVYVCGSEKDFPEYLEYLKSENIMWGGIAAAFAAGGVICIALGVAMSKKDRKKALEIIPVQQEYASVSADTYSALSKEATTESTIEE